MTGSVAATGEPGRRQRPGAVARTRAGRCDLGGRREGGFVAGGEALLLGSLVFVTGLLLVVNAFNVVDARMTADAVAREVVRTLVEADPGPGLAAELDAVATDTLDALGRDGPVQLEVRDEHGDPVADPAAVLARCDRVTVRATITTDTVRLPFVGGWGRAWSITGDHHELIDPYRSGLPGEADCAT